MSWSRDGRHVAVYGESLVHILDPQRLRIEKILDCAPVEAKAKLTKTERVPFSNRTNTYETRGGYISMVDWVADSPDLLLVLVRSEVQKDRLEYWNMKTGMRLRTNDFDVSGMSPAGLSRDGKRVLMSGVNDRFSVFELEPFRLAATVSGMEADWWTDNDHLLTVNRGGDAVVLRRIADETDSLRCTDQMLESAGVRGSPLLHTSSIQLSTSGKLIAVVVGGLYSHRVVVFLDRTLTPLAVLAGE